MMPLLGIVILLSIAIIVASSYKLLPALVGAIAMFVFVFVTFTMILSILEYTNVLPYMGRYDAVIAAGTLGLVMLSFFYRNKTRVRND